MARFRQMVAAVVITRIGQQQCSIGATPTPVPGQEKYITLSGSTTEQPRDTRATIAFTPDLAPTRTSH
jgi:hypothetical protein